MNQDNTRETARLGFDLATACLFLSLFFQTLTVVTGKSAALSIEQFTLWNVLTNGYYLISLLGLGLQAIVWQLALRKFPLSFAYFFMSLIFVNILVISHTVFDESVSAGNAVGALMIVAGVILLTRANNPTEVNHE